VVRPCWRPRSSRWSEPGVIGALPSGPLGSAAPSISMELVIMKAFASSPSTSPAAFQIRFRSLFDSGRALAFPCDANGRGAPGRPERACAPQLSLCPSSGRQEVLSSRSTAPRAALTLARRSLQGQQRDRRSHDQTLQRRNSLETGTKLALAFPKNKKVSWR